MSQSQQYKWVATIPRSLATSIKPSSSQHQAIIPGLTAVGTSQSGEWIFSQQVGMMTDSTLSAFKYGDHLLVETNSCYSMVGANRFISVLLTGGVAVVTPLPQEQIQFQPEDVLGVYVESALGDGRGIPKKS